MKNFLLLSCLLLTLSFSSTSIKESRQLLVVTAKSWKSQTGILQRYKKRSKKWYKVGKTINVHLGRNGLGWGRGLHTIPKNAKIVKKEGDGKAPAGIFELKYAFGYDFIDVKYPYIVYDTFDHCVDDINSVLYNKIIDSQKVKKEYSYNSKEKMKLRTNYYKYGIVVNHNHINEKNAIKGAGSCIFMHIKNTTTAGCTVMKEKDLIRIIKWLDRKKQPLLVQGTKEMLQSFNKVLKIY